MESLVKYVVGEMSTIAHAPAIFIVALLVVTGGIWWAIDWRYGSVIVNRDAEISSLRTQRDEYKDKLQGATPEQAKARIDALETRIASIAPRRLTSEQSAALTASLKPPAGASYSIALTSEASGDSPQYEADFNAAFRAAGGWAIVEPSVMGIGNRPPQGIAVRFPDLNTPPPEAHMLMDALRSINLAFDIQQGGFNPNTARIELLICTKIIR